MPRIVVSVGVFALIAFSIGFNIVRYSVVWEMAGGSPQLSQPSQPSHSAAVPEPAAVLQSEAAVQSAASWNSAAAEPSPRGFDSENSYQDSPVEDTFVDGPAADVEEVEEEGTGYEDPYDYAARPPEEVEASSRYSAGVDPAEALSRSASGGWSIHVLPSDVGQDPTGDRDLGREVRRLPPVDRVAPSTADRYAPRSPQDPGQIYPGSGT